MNDDDHDVLALPDVSVPARKQFGAAETPTSTHLIRRGQRFSDLEPSSADAKVVNEDLILEELRMGTHRAHPTGA